MAQSGMAILDGLRLQEAHRRQVALRQGVIEILEVILVLGLVRLADHGGGAGRQMPGIGGLRIILEGLVMGDVVGDGLARDVDRFVAADRLAVLAAGRAESALEPAPGDALVVQQIADVASGQCDEAPLGIGAVVEQGIGIGDHGPLHHHGIALVR